MGTPRQALDGGITKGGGGGGAQVQYEQTVSGRCGPAAAVRADGGGAFFFGLYTTAVALYRQCG